LSRVTFPIIAAAGLALVGCSSSTPPPHPATAASSSAPATANQINDWFSLHGQADVDSIGKAATAVADDASTSNTALLGIDCLTLKMAAGTAQLHPPIPDTVGQQHWSKALDLFASGAADCVTGANAQDVAAIQRSTDKTAQATVEIQQVTARIKAIRAGQS
jgi:hypothetical protein